MTEKEVHPTREYLGILGFILGWFGLFLLLVAVLFGKHIGLKWTLLTSLGFWTILIIIFGFIFLINIAGMFYLKLRAGFRRKMKKPMHLPPFFS
jgi:hypothetical protein